MDKRPDTRSKHRQPLKHIRGNFPNSDKGFFRICQQISRQRSIPNSHYLGFLELQDLLSCAGWNCWAVLEGVPTDPGSLSTMRLVPHKMNQETPLVPSTTTGCKFKL